MTPLKITIKRLAIAPFQAHSALSAPLETPLLGPD